MNRKAQDIAVYKTGQKIARGSQAVLDSIVKEIQQLRKEGPMPEEFVLVNDLAGVIDLDRKNTRSYIRKLGIKPHTRKTVGTNYQAALAITAEEARQVIQTRETEGLLPVIVNTFEPKIGFFYVVQLVPDLDKKRIKLGFTDNLEIRIEQYRYAAPTAKVVKSWPCKREWKNAAWDGILSDKCKKLSSDVFECDSLKALLRRGDALFALLPKVEISAEDDKNEE